MILISTTQYVQVRRNKCTRRQSRRGSSTILSLLPPAEQIKQPHASTTIPSRMKSQTFLCQLFVENQFAMPQIVEDGTKVSWVSVNHISPSLILLKRENKQKKTLLRLLYHNYNIINCMYLLQHFVLMFLF